MVNSIFGVDACCGCGPPAVEGCEEPGQVFDDFSIEQDMWLWLSPTYYDDYVDQVNEWLETSPGGVLGCMQTGLFQTDWYLEQEVDYTTGTKNTQFSMFVLNGRPYSIFGNGEARFTYYHFDSVSFFGWFVRDALNVRLSGSVNYANDNTYNLKIRISQVDGAWGSCLINFLVDDVSIHSDVYLMNFTRQTYHTMFGNIVGDDGSGNMSYADDYTFTIGVPAAGPGPTPGETILFRNILPSVSKTHQGHKTPNHSFTRFLLPQMSHSSLST